MNPEMSLTISHLRHPFFALKPVPVKKLSCSRRQTNQFMRNWNRWKKLSARDQFKFRTVKEVIQTPSICRY
uniref:Uncharacterized protein n=1 Tax=Rhizophora mucronata TaxID=61149 RepID=A0A2P2PEH5_RHIMU